jgi:hypothetical protein
MTLALLSSLSLRGVVWFVATGACAALWRVLLGAVL